MTLQDAIRLLEERYPKLGCCMRPFRLGGFQLHSISMNHKGEHQFALNDVIPQDKDGVVRCLPAPTRELTCLSADIHSTDWIVVMDGEPYPEF